MNKKISKALASLFVATIAASSQAMPALAVSLNAPPYPPAMQIDATTNVADRGTPSPIPVFASGYTEASRGWWACQFEISGAAAYSEPTGVRNVVKDSNQKIQSFELLNNVGGNTCRLLDAEPNSQLADLGTSNIFDGSVGTVSYPSIHASFPNVTYSQIYYPDGQTTGASLVVVTSARFTYNAVDSTAPTFSSASVSSSGTEISVVFSEPIQSSSQGVGDFTVEVDGMPVFIDSKSISTSTLTLNFGNPIYTGQTVTVRYNGPGPFGVVTDLANNNLSAFGNQSVTNNSAQTQQQSVSGPSLDTAPGLVIDQSNSTITVSPTAVTTPPSSPVLIELLACPNALFVQLVSGVQNFLSNSNCYALYSSRSSGLIATNLATAWAEPYGTGQPTEYSEIASTVKHLALRVMDSSTQPPAFHIITASQEYAPTSSGSPASTADVSRPYTGPIIQTPQISGPAAPGGKLILPGNNLETVSSVEIGGESASVEFNENGDLEIVVPKDLAPGTYDLVVVSDFGRLTIQDAITVTSAELLASSGEARPSMKRGDDDTVKVRVFDVVNAGKVQIIVNNREIVWIRADDFADPRLTAFGYLVRTVALKPGRNVIEVYVDGERVDRKVYTLFGSDSNNN